MTNPDARAAMIAARDALRALIYEITHLSPMNDDGSHSCRISHAALESARAASAAIDSAPAPQPVAWQYRGRSRPDGEWTQWLHWVYGPTPPGDQSYPSGTMEFRPLYAHPAPTVDADAVRRDALEEAARAISCDCIDVCGESPGYEACANELAARIRALATPAPAALELMP